MLLFVVLGLLWFISPVTVPNQGVWYCEELNTTLDFEKESNTMTQKSDGIEIIYQVDCAYSGAIYYYSGQTNERKVFGHVCKELLSFPDCFTCLLYETKEKYTFTRIK